MSRPKQDAQGYLDCQASHLAVTRKFHSRYEAISATLDACPAILNLLHKDLEAALAEVRPSGSDAYRFRFTSENVLRILIVQILEGLSLRDTVVRIDDSKYLPHFTRLGNRPMMDFGHLDRLKNNITPETWKQVNQILAKHAVEQELVSGESLRMDTTAVETNIHYPTDSSLLWDCYRVLARLIRGVRDWDPQLVGNRRLQDRTAKKYQHRIARQAAKKGHSSDSLKPLYKVLLAEVDDVSEWAGELLLGMKEKLRSQQYSYKIAEAVEFFVCEISHYLVLSKHVMWQATERVLNGQQVANDEKLFSIFEDHTELLIRGKAGKPIEYGHMIQIEQVDGKFITGYGAFDKKPVEHQLVRPALESHRELFGDYPDTVTGDKGYWENREALAELQKLVPQVAIAKKGRRTTDEQAREAEPDFTWGQRFRAGVEGTISYLKRVFGLARCRNKGWVHFAATVGAAIFVHNLVVLARC